MGSDYPLCVAGTDIVACLGSDSDADSERCISEGWCNYGHIDQFLCMFPGGLPCDPNAILVRLCGDCRTTDTDIECPAVALAFPVNRHLLLHWWNCRSRQSDPWCFHCRHGQGTSRPVIAGELTSNCLAGDSAIVAVWCSNQEAVLS